MVVIGNPLVVLGIFDINSSCFCLLTLKAISLVDRGLRFATLIVMAMLSFLNLALSIRFEDLKTLDELLMWLLD